MSTGNVVPTAVVSHGGVALLHLQSSPLRSRSQVLTMAGMQVLNGFRDETGVYHCNDGYFYHYNNCNDYARNGGGSPVHYLRCKNYYGRGCTGSAKVTSNDDGVHWENLTRHICARDHEFARVRVLREDIIQEAVRLDGPYEAPGSVVERIRNRCVICVCVCGFDVFRALTDGSDYYVFSEGQTSMSRHASLQKTCVPPSTERGFMCILECLLACTT